MLWYAGDWSFRTVDGRHIVTIGQQPFLEVTAGGPFAGMATLYAEGERA